MVVEVMDCLDPSPTRRVAGRVGNCAQSLGPPFVFVALVKSSRIKRGQGVAAYSLLIFEHERQLRLEPQIRADKDSPQRIGIFLIKRFAVVALVAGFQADEVSGRLIAGPIIADDRPHAYALPLMVWSEPRPLP